MPLPIFVRPPAPVPPPVSVRVVLAVFTSKVAFLPALAVKLRFVEVLPPVYCSAPPLKTRFAAALEDAPRVLGAPPLASVPMLSVPFVIVVAPV